MSSMIKKSFNSKEKLETNKKYFLPAAKQWVFSQYNYNKHKTKDNIIKSKFIEKVVNSFVNIYTDSSFNKLKNQQQDERLRTARSLRKLKRRSRNQTKRRRRSLKKLVVQKPEMKLTNDSLILNLYFYNGEKNNLFRKLFFLKNSIKNINPWRLINEKSLFVSPLNLNTFNELVSLEKGSLNNNLNFFRLLNKKKRKQQFFKRKKIFKLRQNLNWFQKTLTLLLLKKQAVLKGIFFFRFLKWLLKKSNIWVYLFRAKFHFILALRIRNQIKQIKIRITFPREKNKIKIRARLRNKFIFVIQKINKILFHLVLFFVVPDLNRFGAYSLLRKKYLEKKKSFKNENLRIKERSFNKTELIGLKQNFEFFKKKYYSKLLKRTLKKEKLIFKNLIFLTRNNLKLSHFIQRLKLFVQKISDNKQIKLNLISLKQFFLNANLITRVLAQKLKPRKASSLRIANKFLTIVKFPNSSLYFKKRLKPSLSLNQIITQKLFKTNQIANQKVKLSEKEVISEIKTKWVKGIKINFSGRLTKRYKAARSLNKTSIKGSLTNHELRGNNYNVMLRGDIKSNMEHSFRPSKKHIGAFGVKGWITTK